MNYTVAGSLSMSVIGLVLIYIAATNIEPDTLEIGEINAELVGKTVSTEGYIKSEKMNENGHLFITISDGNKNLQVPIFSSVMQHMEESDFKKGYKLKVTGLVDEYRGQLQIIPRKPEDIKPRRQ